MLAAAAVLLAACGARESANGPSSDLTPRLDRIARESHGSVYWLGRSFEGLPLTHSEPSRLPPAPGPSGNRAPRPALRPGPFFVYGECRGEGDGDSYHCTGPQVQLQHWPLVNPSRYPRHLPCTRTTIRGVPAAQFDGFELYTGSVLVRIYAPTRAQARRAAAALRPVDANASPSEPLPQPAIDVATGLRRCALDSLAAKVRELRTDARIPLLWAGRQFEGRPLFRAEGDGRWARFLYGACKTPDVAGACWPPLTVEVVPAGEAHPAGWRAVGTGAVRCRLLRVRGVEAALLPYAHELVVFTGRVAARLQGPDLTLLRRAADVLRPLDAARPSTPLPPPAGDVRDELRRVCGRR